MTQTQDIWALLEGDAPTGCEAVQDLYSWSLNYDAGTGPFTLFLDLIAYNVEHYGENSYDYNLVGERLGYVELDKLGLALREYALNPHDVHAYVFALMDAEMQS